MEGDLCSLIAVTLDIEKAPGEFLSFRRCQQDVRAKVEENFPTEGLPDLASLGNAHIPCPEQVGNVLKPDEDSPPLSQHKTLNGVQPAFLARQFGNMIGEGQMKDLIRRYRRLEEVGIKP